MIRRGKDSVIEAKENRQGGIGTVLYQDLLFPDELYQKGRAYKLTKLLPGASIGVHSHEGEMESYYILSGTAEYDDNGEIVQLSAGDTTWTGDKESHGIKNIGEDELVWIALILYQ